MNGADPLLSTLVANEVTAWLANPGTSEMQRTGAGAAGSKASMLLDLGEPNIDFVTLAKGMGLGAARCKTPEALEAAFAGTVAQRGPMFIEAVI